MTRRPVAWCVATLVTVGVAGCSAGDAGVRASRSDSIPTDASDATDATDAPDTTEDSAGGTATPAPPGASGEIEWSPSGPGLQEGRLQVLIDPSDPDGDTFSLHMVRHLADPDTR